MHKKHKKRKKRKTQLVFKLTRVHFRKKIFTQFIVYPRTTGLCVQNLPRNFLPFTVYFRYYLVSHNSTRSSAIAEGPRDASCQLKSCQLPCNSAETTYTSPDQTDGMKLDIQSQAMRDRQCALKHDATESAAIVSGVINKPTTVELCISPVYRRLAVVKFSKSTMQKLLT